MTVPVWALINTYYAVLAEKAYYPDLIHIFAEDLYSDQLENAVEGVRILSEEFGFTPEIETRVVREAEFIEAGMKINSLVKELKDNGFAVAIDITPGRKALFAAALIAAIKLKVDHVFYLAIKSLENADRPYMMIPLSIQSLRDFAEEVRRYEGNSRKT